MLAARVPWRGRSTEIILPETNMAPENQWLEDVFPIEIVRFRGHVSFREGNMKDLHDHSSQITIFAMELVCVT